MKSRIVLSAIIAVFVASLAAADGVFPVRGHGAVGDGKTHDTDAINQAIQACANAGGGQVRVSPGVYLCGTIHLKSNVALWLDAGATIKGTSELDRYQWYNAPEGTPESRNAKWHSALILGVGVENVSIAGPGVIDGAKVFNPKGEERMRGPHTIIIGDSKGVLIRDVTVIDSANYALFFEYSSHIEVRRVVCKGGWDGAHFRGWIGQPCRDIKIVDCEFYTGDDSIAGRYAEDVLITGCVINSSCNGIRIIGPVERMIVNDCLFYGPGIYPHRTQDRHNMLAGIILQPGAWDPSEGAMDDVLISDIVMKNVLSPVTLFLRRPGNTASNITISGLDATGVYRAAASVESWSDTAVENVAFRDVSIHYAGGESEEKGNEPAQKPGVGARPLPAWGFFAKNVNRLTLDNVKLTVENEDLRPALIAEDVGMLALDEFDYSKPERGGEGIRLTNTKAVEKTQ